MFYHLYLCFDNQYNSLRQSIEFSINYDMFITAEGTKKLHHRISDQKEIRHDRKRKHSVLGYLSSELLDKLLMKYRNTV